jgi:hypothetical protein
MSEQTGNTSTSQGSSKFHGMSPLPYEEKLKIIQNDYNPKVHAIGIPFSVIHIFLMLVPGLFLLVAYNVWPGWDVILKAVVPIWLALGLIYVIEPLQYYLALGTVGLYVASITGNTSNIRLPTTVATQEVIGVEPGSPEAEVVSGIAIITSQWVMAGLILIAALSISWVIGILPAAITKSFDFLIPALFGGMLVNMGLTQWRYTVVALSASLILFFLGVNSSLMTFIVVFLMIGLSLYLYRKGIWVPKKIAAAAVEDD